MVNKKMLTKHKKKIIVNCWKCKKPFDIVTAERCYDHLNDEEDYKWGTLHFTTKCSNCNACICHKIEEMKNIKCDVLNKVGIMRVMPSVKRQLTKEGT